MSGPFNRKTSSNKLRLVSACLIGIDCRYDGKNNTNQRLIRLFRKGKLIPVCPEQLGGLPTPRDGAQIINGTGKDVLEGRARVVDKKGHDVTENFIKGAMETLKIAKYLGVKEAILKARSPSCGSGKIHKGFSDVLIDGDGVTATLLKMNGIRIFTEEEFVVE